MTEFADQRPQQTVPPEITKESTEDTRIIQCGIPVAAETCYIY
jgi:hypothetical protein